MSSFPVDYSTFGGQILVHRLGKQSVDIPTSRKLKIWGKHHRCSCIQGNQFRVAHKLQHDQFHTKFYWPRSCNQTNICNFVFGDCVLEQLEVNLNFSQTIILNDDVLNASWTYVAVSEFYSRSIFFFLKEGLRCFLFFLCELFMIKKHFLICVFNGIEVLFHYKKGARILISFGSNLCSLMM